MNSIHILFLWSPDETLKNKLQNGLSSASNLQLWFPPHTENKEHREKFCAEHAKKAHIMVGWRPKREWLWSAENLKLIINPGTGVQHILPLIRELNQKKAVTFINGHGHAHLTAQHTVALLLSLTNRIVPHHQWMTEGIWRTGDENSPSIPLYNRKIGLLGYGAINQNVHQLLSSFGMEFAILKRTWKEPFEENSLLQKAKRYTPNELSDFLQYIDTLIIAVPQTEKTEAMIGEKELQLLGKNGLLVNVARGVIVEEKPLFEALQNQTIAGAAIDVWYNYRPKADEKGRKHPYQFPFHKLDNIVLSPHRAGSPFSEMTRWDELIDNILLFAAGDKNLKNVVDLVEGY